MSAIETVTADWIRNASDERAAADGCFFAPEVGGFVVWWIERFCRLYEGEQAGESLVLRGCHECDHSAFEALEEFDESAAIERASLFAECVRAGHAVDWQYDVTMRMFGWQVYSNRWKRNVRRFRQACIYVPKKNKKSPTLAAWGLYLACGDGEPGQKVFFGAKDGNQAREIAGKHAIEMLSQSVELMAECSINQSLKRITHEPSRSILQPMSSANATTQRSKEGLNGSLLIDETHVVDRDFMRIISRAGISRSEPVHGEFSTAGDNPDGYGKERFDLACDIISGKQYDQEVLAVVYAAPQSLTAEELAKDPLKFGRMANPAMGHTVDSDEYLKDYHRSKGRQSDLADFMMYRLNVWQHSASPWLNSSDWSACYELFSEDDMLGELCYAALDLSRTKDTSSLQLLFPRENGEFRLLSYFWLPEQAAKRYEHLVRWSEFAACGDVTLIPGEVVEYDYIERKFIECAEKFSIQSLAYDRTYAHDVTLRMEEATGVERVEFSQGWAAMAGPTAELERLVVSHRLRHNGNRVMTWQCGHATVKTDNNGNKRILKPSNHQKVDGPVAAVMTVGMAMAEEQDSVYTSRGAVSIGDDGDLDDSGATPVEYQPAAASDLDHVNDVDFWG